MDYELYDQDQQLAQVRANLLALEQSRFNATTQLRLIEVQLKVLNDQYESLKSDGADDTDIVTTPDSMLATPRVRGPRGPRGRAGMDVNQ